MKKTWQLLQGLILIVLLIGIPLIPVSAQASEPSRPIDMMILIDNSCSMFPANRILAGCDAYGSDPNQLRITGADLFIARLGFGEPNEADYRLGVVGLGDQPVQVSPLGSLTANNRDSLAQKIANPQPQPATRIVPALQMAYDALKDSAQTTPARLPAVVMITDGVPWPRENQGNDDIENVVSQHSQIPLFIMLLKNPVLHSADYDSYINFWEKLQGKYPFIIAYQISDASQIQDTYNQILSQLQNTIPAKGTLLEKNSQTTFMVGDYVQKVIVTAIRQANQPKATITITDPTGARVDPKESGVTYFRGKDNPIEVYVITAPRLSGGQKSGLWTVTSSDPVMVMVDRIGSYRFEFLSPRVKSAGWGAYYQATSRQYTDHQISIRFQLVDPDSKPILDPQPIQVTISNQDGKTIEIPQKTLFPDSSGVYDLPMDLTTLFPSSDDPSGRYQFTFTAGQLSSLTNDQSPVASASLSVEMGKAPTIRSIVPLPVSCRAGQPAALQVAVDNIDSNLKDLLGVKVSYKDRVLSLAPDGEGGFSGDITDLCQSMLSQAACATITTAHLNIELGVSSDAVSLPELTRAVDANIIAAACTATPLPTITPTPTPAPTPIPDRDQDQVNDLVDRCPDTWGFPFDQGCIPWNAFLGGGGVLILLGLVRGMVWPWMKTSWISPAPAAYLAAYRDGARMFEPVAIHALSRKKRSSRLVVGGKRRRADIYVEGLKASEYLIEWWGGAATLREPGEKEPLAYFDETVRSVRTSDPKVILYIGVEPSSFPLHL